MLEEALLAAHLTHSACIICAAWILISRSDHTFYTGASAGSLMQLGKCINDLLLGGEGVFFKCCRCLLWDCTDEIYEQWKMMMLQSDDDDDDKFDGDG